jgi:hypothetical protein
LSFEVLDDLVMAVDTVDLSGVEQRLLVPIAERAAEQLRLTLETNKAGAVECPWGFMNHRPILRPIAHLAYVCMDAGNWQRFMELAHWLVWELNPNDNHGLRQELSCAYVRFQRWADVLALNERYPHDSQPTLLLNTVLATWVTGDHVQARQLIKQVSKEFAVATKMLLGPVPKPIKPDGDFGVVVGGKFEAWLYVSKMREFWDQRRALDWAREILRPSKRSPGA